MSEVDQKGQDLAALSVLIVEDEYFIAAEMTELLQKAGATVVGPFATAGEGLAQLNQVMPDCALVDINTGNGPSFELADALVLHGVPFLFLTGYDAGTVPDRFSKIARIEKPADEREVLAELIELRPMTIRAPLSG
ncbi:hypothetical protein A0U87_23170 [Sphingobium sp. MP9-4]|uniref:response regulator n=1 Tax=Sphingobium sp. MP9-4 TaxID=1761936 RepID=UPI00113E7E69|nr:response regulator [Sphingobium sp. MP9-4]TKV40910.1 hypothetical protein A0U87_23170 [Sphingobium sp. MP9-4]